MKKVILKLINSSIAHTDKIKIINRDTLWAKSFKARPLPIGKGNMPFGERLV